MKDAVDLRASTCRTAWALCAIRVLSDASFRHPARSRFSDHLVDQWLIVLKPLEVGQQDVDHVGFRPPGLAAGV